MQFFLFGLLHSDLICAAFCGFPRIFHWLWYGFEINRFVQKVFVIFSVLAYEFQCSFRLVVQWRTLEASLTLCVLLTLIIHVVHTFSLDFQNSWILLCFGKLAVILSQVYSFPVHTAPRTRVILSCHLPSFHSGVPKDSYVFLVLSILATCPPHCSFLDFTIPIILWKWNLKKCQPIICHFGL